MHGHKQNNNYNFTSILRLAITQIDLLHNAHQNHLQCGCIFEDDFFFFFENEKNVFFFIATFN
jgi:hypothetical protein